MALRFGWLIAKGQFFSHKARASGMPRMKEIRSLQVLSLLHFAYSNCSVTAAIFNNITDSLAKPSTFCLVSTLPSCLQYGPAQPQVIENSCLNNLGLSQGTSFLLSSSQGCDRQITFSASEQNCGGYPDGDILPLAD